MVEERTQQLVHADRLATIGTLAAAIVHEVNGPLAYIRGNAELLNLFWDKARPFIYATKIKPVDRERQFPKLMDTLKRFLMGKSVSRRPSTLSGATREKTRRAWSRVFWQIR